MQGVTDGVPGTGVASAIEQRLQEELLLFGTLICSRSAMVIKHAQLWKRNRSEADENITSIVKPKERITLALVNAQGKQMSQALSVQALSEDPSARAEGAGPGDVQFNEAIHTEVTTFRNCALREMENMLEDPVDPETVKKCISNLKLSSAALRFRRKLI